MAWKYEDLGSFRSDVQSIAASVRQGKFNEAAAQWRLGRMIRMPSFTDEALRSGYYKYDPQAKLYVAGDPTPATCESDPQEVDLRVGDSISTKLHCWEKKYRVCRKDDCTKTLTNTVEDKEFAVSLALGEVMFSEMWYGYEALGTYGLFNHPLAIVAPTPAPQAATVGLTNWASKTANEIYGELRDAMIGMQRPRLAISEAAWNAGADKILSGGDNCNRLGDCIVKFLESAFSTGTFTKSDIFIMKFLDNPQIGGVDTNGVYVVWDDDAVEYPTSDPEFLTPMPNKKRVDVIRSICTAGTVVKYADSLKVVTGINLVNP